MVGIRLATKNYWMKCAQAVIRCCRKDLRLYLPETMKDYPYWF